MQCTKMQSGEIACLVIQRENMENKLSIKCDIDKFIAYLTSILDLGLRFP